MFGLLMDIYLKYGYFHEELLSLTYKGLQGKQQISDMMARLRNTPPASLGGSAVVELRDYDAGLIRNLSTGEETPTGLPKSNVLQFHLADGSVVTGRPSGTEPKIKFYFSLRAEMNDSSFYPGLRDGMTSRIRDIRRDLGVQ
jgi:phosphoglucomutase